MALSLIPSFIMLGGFKFVIYMALEGTVVVVDKSTILTDLDTKLTWLGIGGAFILFTGR